jgi:tRNA threonylcarbamoyl adenosine modification protein (Sua5/YciO/YrdC/YwlC family)
MLVKINPLNPQPRHIDRAVAILQDGGIIIYPTDTFYGIGCDIFNKKAIERIYQLKKRPKDKPFSFICSSLTDIAQYAQVGNYAYKTMKRLLPGPYTFLLEGSRLVPKIMLTKRRVVGIRVPDNQIALAIVAKLGHPIVSTSATTPEGEVLTDPELIQERLGKEVDLVIDAGPLGFEPSSVVSLIEDTPEIVRKGKGDVSEFL